MSKRRTLPDGDDLLGIVLPESGGHEKRKQKGKKIRVAFHLPVEVADAARNTVYALSGPPVRLTLAALAEGALRGEIKRLEKEHNGGEPFEVRGAELVGGRPIAPVGNVGG